jgi:hypothetical protein
MSRLSLLKTKADIQINFGMRHPQPKQNGTDFANGAEDEFGVHNYINQSGNR